jgi:hypothetical protein
MLLTVDEIITQYPNQWVLLGNPEMKLPTSNGTLMNRLIQGIVIFASKDKREIAFRAKDIVANYDETACLFTGESPKNRVFLL